MWQTIDTAPKGQYVKRKQVRQDGKEVEFDHWVAPQVLVALDGEVYLTSALASGRWNGFSEKGQPTHWMPIPSLPH